jgi:hypothetical protein
MSLISFPFGLPKPQNGAGRIPDKAQPTHANYFRSVLHDLSAQRFRFPRRGANVIHLNVSELPRVRPESFS